MIRLTYSTSLAQACFNLPGPACVCLCAKYLEPCFIITSAPLSLPLDLSTFHLQRGPLVLLPSSFSAASTLYFQPSAARKRPLSEAEAHDGPASSRIALSSSLSLPTSGPPTPPSQLSSLRRAWQCQRSDPPILSFFCLCHHQHTHTHFGLCLRGHSPSYRHRNQRLPQAIAFDNCLKFHRLRLPPGLGAKSNFDDCCRCERAS